MESSLTGQELVDLVGRVFRPTGDDGGLAILIDLPDARRRDHVAWQERRRLAVQWSRDLDAHRGALGLSEVVLCAYPNVGANNADLPEQMFRLPLDRADDLIDGGARASPLSESVITMDELWQRCRLAMAVTELSATAPLKNVARQHGIRGVTMPGFTAAMVPALRLDYEQVNRRVNLLKQLLDEAEGAQLHFKVGGDEHRLHLDLRFREGHASGGLQHRRGQVGNLPSGEAYIVPYEGEGEASRTAGVLPVQFGSDVVLYGVRGNRAVEVVTDNEASRKEADLLRREWGYGNLAELGLGVLGDLGIEPCGEVLLDEKLGLHVAFGRSDHFGGQVGPDEFSNPSAVVHIDRVYVPQTQPAVEVLEVALVFPKGRLQLMSRGRYVVDLDGVLPEV